jgi:hypothetical protein
LRYFLDCEFNGFGGELMSMALVSEADDEFYEVLEIDGEYEPWVAENVVPYLGKPSVFMEEFRSKLFAFLRVHSDVEIVCDWPADALYLMFVMMGADHTETQMIPMTIKMVDLGELKSAIPHNALWDARAIRMVVLEA